MKWQVGDVAIIVRALYLPRAVGSECEITVVNGSDSYEIFIPSFPSTHPTQEWSARGFNLGKLPDGNLTSTWDETIFKPKELVSILKV